MSLRHLIKKKIMYQSLGAEGLAQCNFYIVFFSSCSLEEQDGRVGEEYGRNI